MHNKIIDTFQNFMMHNKIVRRFLKNIGTFSKFYYAQGHIKINFYVNFAIDILVITIKIYYEIAFINIY